MDITKSPQPAVVVNQAEAEGINVELAWYAMQTEGVDLVQLAVPDSGQLQAVALRKAVAVADVLDAATIRLDGRERARTEFMTGNRRPGMAANARERFNPLLRAEAEADAERLAKIQGYLAQLGTCFAQLGHSSRHTPQAVRRK